MSLLLQAICNLILFLPARDFLVLTCLDFEPRSLTVWNSTKALVVRHFGAVETGRCQIRLTIAWDC